MPIATPDFTSGFETGKSPVSAEIYNQINQNVASLEDATSGLSDAFDTMQEVSDTLIKNGGSLSKVFKYQAEVIKQVTEAVNLDNRSSEEKAILMTLLDRKNVASLKTAERQIKVLQGQKIALAAQKKALQDAGKNTAEVEQKIHDLTKQLDGATDALKSYQEAQAKINIGNRSSRNGLNDSLDRILKQENWRQISEEKALQKKMYGGFGAKFFTGAISAKRDAQRLGGVRVGTSDADAALKEEITAGDKAKTVLAAASIITQKLGAAVKSIENARIQLQEYKKATEQAAHAMGMMDSKPLENLRDNLDLTRDQASKLFAVMDKGMTATGKTAEELASVAEILKKTFGGDITEQLQNYIDLLKDIPTLQEDLTTGSSEDQEAALYALAKTGKAGELNALMPTGLFGGEQKRQPGADKLDTAQYVKEEMESIGDFLMDILPRQASYLPIISDSITKLGTTVFGIATVIGAIQAVNEVFHTKSLATAETAAESAAATAQAETAQTAQDTKQRSWMTRVLERAFRTGRGGGGGVPPAERTAPASGGGGRWQWGGGGLSRGAQAGIMAAGTIGAIIGENLGSKFKEEAKDALASGDLQKAKADRNASIASRTLGDMAAGAAMGAMFGPLGLAIGATGGAIVGFGRSLMATSEISEKIRNKEAKNIANFGQAIAPVTYETEKWDETVKASGDIMRSRTENLIKSARVLQDALGKLSAGVNNAKAMFYKLKIELANLKFKQVKELGGTNQDVRRAMLQSIMSASKIYQQRAKAVSLARTEATSNTNLTSEAKDALMLEAEKEAQNALMDFAETVLSAADAVSLLPKYLNNQFSVESLDSIISGGLVGGKNALENFASRAGNVWDKKIQEISEVEKKRIDELDRIDKAASQANFDNLKRLSGEIQRLSTNIPASHTQGMRHGRDMVDRVNKYNEEIRDAQEAIENAEGDIFSGNSHNVVQQNRKKKEDLTKQRDDFLENIWKEGQNAAQGKVASKYGERIQKLTSSGQIDTKELEGIISELDAEITAQSRRLKDSQGAKNMESFFALNENRQRREQLQDQLDSEKDPNKKKQIEEQISGLQLEFENDLKPAFKEFLDQFKGLDENSKKTALDFIDKNGLSTFMTMISTGRLQKTLGMEDIDPNNVQNNVLKDFMEAMNGNLASMLDVHNLSESINVLKTYRDRLSSSQGMGSQTDTQRLKAHQTAISSEKDLYDKMIQAQSTMAQGGFKEEVAEAAQEAAKVMSNDKLTTDMKNYGKVFEEQLKLLGKQTKEAAEAMAIIDKQIKDFDKDIENSTDRLQKEQQALEDAKNALENLSQNASETEKQAAQQKVDYQQSRVDQEEANVATKRKQREQMLGNLQTARENLNQNAFDNLDFMKKIDGALSAGMDKAEGLLAKAITRAAEAASSAVPFSKNVKDAAETAKKLQIEAAVQSAAVQEEAIKAAESALDKTAEEVYNATYASQKAAGVKDDVAKETAEKMKQLTLEQGQTAIQAARLKKEADFNRSLSSAITQRYDSERRIVDLQQSAVESMTDFAENYGGAFSEVLQLQNISVQLERQKYELAVQELKEAEASHIEGEELAKRQLAVVQAEISMKKKEIGVAKSMMDRMLGAAFGQIRSAFGAKTQMGSLQHLMGVKDTRIQRADGSYVAGDPKTIAERQFMRSQASAFGNAPNVLAHATNTSENNGVEQAAQVLSNSADIYAKYTDIFGRSVESLNSLLGQLGNFKPETKKIGLPGFASGTDDSPKGPVLVGENGPEIVVMKGGEKVIPHNKIGSLAHYASGTDNANKGYVVAGEKGSELLIPSKPTITRGLGKGETFSRASSKRSLYWTGSAKEAIEERDAAFGVAQNAFGSLDKQNKLIADSQAAQEKLKNLQSSPIDEQIKYKKEQLAQAQAKIAAAQAKIGALNEARRRNLSSYSDSGFAKSDAELEAANAELEAAYARSDKIKDSSAAKLIKSDLEEESAHENSLQATRKSLEEQAWSSSAKAQVKDSLFRSALGEDQNLYDSEDLKKPENLAKIGKQMRDNAIMSDLQAESDALGTQGVKNKGTYMIGDDGVIHHAKNLNRSQVDENGIDWSKGRSFMVPGAMARSQTNPYMRRIAAQGVDSMFAGGRDGKRMSPSGSLKRDARGRLTDRGSLTSFGGSGSRRKGRRIGEGDIHSFAGGGSGQRMEVAPLKPRSHYYSSNRPGQSSAQNTPVNRVTSVRPPVASATPPSSAPEASSKTNVSEAPSTHSTPSATPSATASNENETKPINGELSGDIKVEVTMNEEKWIETHQAMVVRIMQANAQAIQGIVLGNT